MMKRNYKIWVLMLVLAFTSCSFTTKKFSDPNKDKVLIQIITYMLEQGHFDPIAIDDAFSKAFFEDYLNILDPIKRYFYESDYKDFEAYKLKIDDQLKAADISFFDIVNTRLLKRLEEVKRIYKEVLSQPFDYSKVEFVNTDYESSSYVTNKRQMLERWRQELKLSTLSTYDDLKKAEQLAKDKDASYRMKSDADIEKEARESSLKSLNIFFEDFIDDQTREDWFAVFVNTIVEEFDPHTYYLAPKSKEDFDQRMSGKLEGIGARLQKRMDYIKVVELISGGPAWRSNELEVEDIILKVKQENEEFAVDIVGMRITDAIKYIKGPKGTKVTLTVKKIDGTLKDITITRDIVEVFDTYAKSSVVEKEGKTFGVIHLPAFYVDFQDYKNINAAKDVKREIEYLKAEGIEGLVLDLRSNGGGSLPAVVDMAGLFIEEGPIVQVRSTGKTKEVLRDRDSSISWDGALVILVNEISASASEIMAAAMQDYKRAIIIGSKQTYGKGTVQNVINLNKMLRSSTADDLGALALTTQKYYRINGGSVQLEGVKSDVNVPGRYSFIDIGEKDKDNPLPWDEIDAAVYTPWNDYFDLDTTIKRSKQRIENNDKLKLIEENAKWVKTTMDKTIFPLNYQEYQKQMRSNEEELKRFEAISNFKTNLVFESTAFEKALIKSDTTNLKEKRDRWHKSLSKDIYVEEALNVLADLDRLSRPAKKVVSTVQTKQ